MATVRFFFGSPLCDFAILSTISLPYRTVRERAPSYNPLSPVSAMWS